MRVASLAALLILVASALPADAGHDTTLAAPAAGDLEAIRATLALPAATWYNDHDGNKVFDDLEERFVGELGTLPVIVTTVQGADVGGVLAQAQEATGGFEPRYVYRTVGGWAADLSLEQATAIAALDGVRQVEFSQPGAPELDTATYHSGASTVRTGLGITGDLDGDPTTFTADDVVIAIMDTGFDGQHVDLKGKFIEFIDWSDGGKSTEPYDSGSHGTHVAGIAGGLGVGDSKYTGVAPGAAFVGYLITSKDDAIASIDHFLSNPELSVDVSTISFGFGTTVDGTDALELAMDKAWEAGVINFKSTGNSGPERGTVTIPGGARGIMGTASLLDPGHAGFHLSSFSSRGPTEDGRLKPDIAAPGQSIMAADVGTGNGYTSKSGTSMASPHAAGVAALVKAADPTLGPDEIRDVLIRTAHDWGPDGHDVDYGHGIIDALRAVQEASLQRALREGWEFDRVQALDVQPPTNPKRFGCSLGGGPAYSGSCSYTVSEAGQPMAATAIMDMEGNTLGRVFLLDVEGPGGATVETISLSPNSRQQVVSLPTAEAGEYTVTIRSGPVNGVVYLDMSYGIAEVLELLLPTPEGGVPLNETTYVEAVGEPVQEAQGDDAEAPGLPLIALLGALLVALRRR